MCGALHAGATSQATYLDAALESPRKSIGTRAAMPASAVQPDVDSRVMEATSDLILEMKLTVRPRGASKDTEACTRAETTEMIETAMITRDEMVVLPVTRARCFLLAGLSEGTQKVGMGRAHEASGGWIRHRGFEGVVEKPLFRGGKAESEARVQDMGRRGIHGNMM